MISTPTTHKQEKEAAHSLLIKNSNIQFRRTVGPAALARTESELLSLIEAKYSIS